MRLSYFIASTLLFSGAWANASELADLKTCLVETRATANAYLRYVPRFVLVAERSIGSNLEHLAILEATTQDLTLLEADPTHDAKLRFATGNGLISCGDFHRTLRQQLRQLVFTLLSASLASLVAILHLFFSIFSQPRNKRTEDSWVSSSHSAAGSKAEPQDKPTKNDGRG